MLYKMTAFFVASDDESDPIAPKMFQLKIKQIYKS